MVGANWWAAIPFSRGGGPSTRDGGLQFPFRGPAAWEKEKSFTFGKNGHFAIKTIPFTRLLYAGL
jgi:hypothetical protein